MPVPWPGMSTIESRGIDISRLGPEPVCMQHDRVGALPGRVAGGVLLALLLGEPGAGVAADHQVRRARLVGRALALGLEVDLVDLVPREQRHGDQVGRPRAGAAPARSAGRSGGRGARGVRWRRGRCDRRRRRRHAAARRCVAGRRLGGRVVLGRDIAGITRVSSGRGSPGRDHCSGAAARPAVQPVVLGGALRGLAVAAGTLVHAATVPGAPWRPRIARRVVSDVAPVTGDTDGAPPLPRTTLSREASRCRPHLPPGRKPRASPPVSAPLAYGSAGPSP